jgi:hypothetical protein
MPELRLSRQQKVAIMVALDKSWRDFRLTGRKAHVRRDGYRCSLQKGKGRCLADPDNFCIEGRNARGSGVASPINPVRDKIQRDDFSFGQVLHQLPRELVARQFQ